MKVLSWEELRRGEDMRPAPSCRYGEGRKEEQGNMHRGNAHQAVSPLDMTDEAGYPHNLPEDRKEKLDGLKTYSLPVRVLAMEIVEEKLGEMHCGNAHGAAFQLSTIDETRHPHKLSECRERNDHAVDTHQ